MNAFKKHTIATKVFSAIFLCQAFTCDASDDRALNTVDIDSRIQSILSTQLNTDAWIENVLDLKQLDKELLRTVLTKRGSQEKSSPSFMHLCGQLGFTITSECQEIISGTPLLLAQEPLQHISDQQESNISRAIVNIAPSITQQSDGFSLEELNRATQDPQYFNALFKRLTNFDCLDSQVLFIRNAFTTSSVFTSEDNSLRATENTKSIFNKTAIYTVEIDGDFGIPLWHHSTAPSYKLKQLLDIKFKLPTNFKNTRQKRAWLETRSNIEPFLELLRAEYKLFVEKDFDGALVDYKKIMLKKNPHECNFAKLRYIELMSLHHQMISSNMITTIITMRETDNKIQKNTIEAFKLLKQACTKITASSQFNTIEELIRMDEFYYYRLGMFYAGFYGTAFKDLEEMKKIMMKLTKSATLDHIAYARLGELYSGHFGDEIFVTSSAEQCKNLAKLFLQKGVACAGSEALASQRLAAFNFEENQDASAIKQSLQALTNLAEWNAVYDYYRGKHSETQKNKQIASLLLVSAALVEDTVPMIKLAHTYYNAGKINDAIQLTERASVHNTNVQALYTLARIYSSPRLEVYDPYKAIHYYSLIMKQGALSAGAAKLLKLYNKVDDSAIRALIRSTIQEACIEKGLTFPITPIVETRDTDNEDSKDAPTSDSGSESEDEYNSDESDDEASVQETLEQVVAENSKASNTDIEPAVFIDPELEVLLNQLKYDGKISFADAKKLTILLGGTVNEESYTLTVPGNDKPFTYHPAHQKNQNRRSISMKRSYWVKWKRQIQRSTTPQGIWDAV